MTETAKFIAKWEGCRLDPYYDVAGYPTIGYGHKLSDDKAADLRQWRSITNEEALAQLDRHLEHFRAGVRDAVRVSLPDNQETALVSFAFNLGLGALRGSELLRILKRAPGPHEDTSAWHIRVTLEWLDWCKATINGRKQVVEGLLNRRRAEVALFFGVDQ